MVKDVIGCVSFVVKGMMNKVYCANNLSILRNLKSNSVDLIYIDPPFNTGKKQKLGSVEYNDKFEDFLSFLEPRLIEAYRVLAEHGTLYFHIDYREVHRCKILLDCIFGCKCFLNEIIWAYDYGGRSKTRWPTKHDNILVYVKSLDEYIFNDDVVNKIDFVAPGRNGKVGVLPTDVWWCTIVPTQGKERTGYPTQKPESIINRIILASSNPGDLVLDFFAGSGTVGKCCQRLDRSFILVDSNPQSIDVIQSRLGYIGVEYKE